MLVEFISELILSLMLFSGYLGIFILMVMESMIFPVPSEAIMPFAGFLVAEGELNLILVIIISSLGSIVGSLISYYIGKYGGRPLILKYGKYLLLNKKHLELTENFFSKKGEATIFISRFIPVVRHLISIPAGIAEMNIWKFCFFTALGAAMWNAFLAWVGFYLKQNWTEIMKYSKFVDIFVIVLMLAGVCYFMYNHFHKTGVKEEKQN